jgi:hypothetical protein
MQLSNRRLLLSNGTLCSVVINRIQTMVIVITSHWPVHTDTTDEYCYVGYTVPVVGHRDNELLLTLG